MTHRILVVDDRPTIRRMVEAMLHSAGYDVVAADCVSAAVECAKHPRRIDLAVLDVELPDGQGFDILESLRARPRPCGVVIMTGNTTAQVAEQVASLNIREFLSKPFPRTALLDAVVRELARVTRP